MKHFFIHAGAFFIAALVETLIESSLKITLGGIPIVLIYGIAFFIANRLSKRCKEKDELKKKNKTSAEDSASIVNEESKDAETITESSLTDEDRRLKELLEKKRASQIEIKSKTLPHEEDFTPEEDFTEDY